MSTWETAKLTVYAALRSGGFLPIVVLETGEGIDDPRIELTIAEARDLVDGLVGIFTDLLASVPEEVPA